MMRLWVPLLDLSRGWRLENAVSYAGNQLCLRDGAAVITLNTGAQVSIPGWQYSPASSHINAGKVTLP